jgi:hypothetical protein
MYLPPVIKLPPAIQQEYDELPTYEQSTDWQKRLFWILNGEGTKAEKNKEKRSLVRELKKWRKNHPLNYSTEKQLDTYLDKMYYSKMV